MKETLLSRNFRQANINSQFAIRYGRRILLKHRRNTKRATKMESQRDLQARKEKCKRHISQRHRRTSDRRVAIRLLIYARDEWTKFRRTRCSRLMNSRSYSMGLLLISRAEKRSVSFQQVVLFVIQTLETHDTGEIIHFLWHQDKYVRVRLIFPTRRKKFKRYTMSIYYYSTWWQHRKWKISLLFAPKQGFLMQVESSAVQKLLKSDLIRLRFHRKRRI